MVKKKTNWKEQAKELGLITPSEFWDWTEEQLSERGCGPGKGLGDLLVPETMWGLRITLACIIHDIDCERVFQIMDKKEAVCAASKINAFFLVNLLKIINTRSRVALKQLRRYRAMTYYTAVEDGKFKFIINPEAQ